MRDDTDWTDADAAADFAAQCGYDDAKEASDDKLMYPRFLAEALAALNTDAYAALRLVVRNDPHSPWVERLKTMAQWTDAMVEGREP